MDLIYANEKREDINVLMDYTLDLAYGRDENDFECTVYRDNHVCRKDYMLYIEGTEYGGIIDKIKVSTSADTISYAGRTWHGILAGKIIEPDAGEDYLILSGEANEVLAFLIKRIGLTDIFRVSTQDSGIWIVEYSVRYQDAYTVIRKMLFEATGKLKIQYKRDAAELSAIPYIDYSQDEEWDSTQLDFQVEKNYRPVNHLICLGSGDLKDRHVIHLFADENGGVQAYKLVEVPLSDADYILDISRQVLFGQDEVTEIYDYPNAADTENYVKVFQKPADWDKSYAGYYKQTDDDKYEALESREEEVYTLQEIAPHDWSVNYKDYYLISDGEYAAVSSISEVSYLLCTAKPSDWKSNYKNYFIKSGDSYKEVSADVTESYRKQTKKPADWKKNYGNYYEYYSDGLTGEYRSVSGVTKYRYLPQTQKPTDWKENYRNYYLKMRSDGGYIQIGEMIDALFSEKETEDDEVGIVLRRENIAWVPKMFYTKESYQVAPAWKKNQYYTQKKTSSTPAWKSGCYYKKCVQSIPAWKSGTYYTKSLKTIIPEFMPDAYFEKRIDHYAELVAGGLEKLKESYDCDKITTSLDPENVYDIGDVVGASEEVTGIAVWQPITKKIVKITDDTEKIEYEIGEK